MFYHVLFLFLQSQQSPYNWCNVQPLDLSTTTLSTMPVSTSTPIPKTPISPLHTGINNQISPIMYPTNYDSSPTHNTDTSSATDSGFESSFTNSLQSIVPQDDVKTKPVAVKRRRIHVRRRLTKLSEVATKVLTSWYDRNKEHPYPTHDTIKILAAAGNMTTEQVQKWFSNRRMRDRNTKPINVIAARRKRLIIDDSSCTVAKRLCQ